MVAPKDSRFPTTGQGEQDSWNETDLMNLSSGVDKLRLPLRWLGRIF